MELAKQSFPFHKLEATKYATINIIIYLKYFDGLSFLWQVNRRGRDFLKRYYDIIRREFENNGLYEHSIFIKNDTKLFTFKIYHFLEKLYLQAMKRQPGQRKITLDIHVNSDPNNDLLKFFKLFDFIVGSGCEIKINTFESSKLVVNKSSIANNLIKYGIKNLRCQNLIQSNHPSQQLTKYLISY